MVVDAQIDDPDFQVFKAFVHAFFYGGSLGSDAGVCCGSSGWPLVLRMMGLGWKGIAVQKNAQTRKRLTSDECLYRQSSQDAGSQQQGDTGWVSREGLEMTS